MFTEKRLWIFIFFVIAFLVTILAFTDSGQAATLNIGCKSSAAGSLSR